MKMTLFHVSFKELLKINHLHEPDSVKFISILQNLCAGMGLTEHGLQSDQTGDKVVKVDGHVGLRVAQDDQLEQLVGQFET